MKQGSIDIRGAGMHAYMWGYVRYSVWVAIAIWLIVSIGLQLWTMWFELLHALVLIPAVATFIYACGRLLTTQHPYFPEIIMCWAWRSFRRAYHLDN